MKLLKWFVLLLLLVGAFAGGFAVRSRRPSTPAPPARRVLYYVDTMNPAYRSDSPGNAPDGMALAPVYADDADAAGASSGPLALPAGAFKVPQERQQLIGVTFATVESGGDARAIRTVGKVTFDETRVAHVHTRVEGWIESVLVDFTGDIVEKGQPMLTIYSPEMLASQQELLLASRARDLMRDNPLASAAEHGESLFEAAKRRLTLWQLSDEQIQQVLRTREPIPNITLYAPTGGFVTERNAFPNQKVTPESDLYTITDLSHIWIVADVFESDVTAIKIGDPALVSFPNQSAPSIAAHVNYIQPQVDPMTRTLKVRLDAVNPGLRMKPDMFVNVEFGVATGKQLLIPSDAVLDSGDRQTVFVDLGNGYLEPRHVELGDHFGASVAVTRGLAAGERVVASGTFLIDSESQMRAAAAGADAPAHAPGQADAVPPGSPSAPAGAAGGRGEHVHD